MQPARPSQQRQPAQSPTTTAAPVLQQPFPHPDSSSTIPVGGWLSRFHQAWAQLTDSTWIHSVIREGFRLHFTTNPPTTHHIKETRPRSPVQRHLLRQEIAALLHKKAIEPADSSPGFGSTMFIIDKKSRGHRPVFNLKALNQHIHALHFRMETLVHVAKLL